MRVCRVRPDSLGLDKHFDYLVPEGVSVSVGDIVRVRLGAHRVRAWVTEIDLPWDDSRQLSPILKRVSAGPTPELMDLARFTAWRFAGSEVALYRTASPPNNIPATFETPPAPANTPGLATVRVLAWPPSADRRPIISESIAPAGSTVIVVPGPGRARQLAHELRNNYRVALFAGSDLERTNAWDIARAGNCVVIGGRLAAFSPIPDLASALILDEGDESLQEERAPTWHAREVLRQRCLIASVPLTLVSPLPTPEGASLGKPQRPKRNIERDGWARIEVIDPRHVAPGRGLFTEPVTESIHRALVGNKVTLIVVNRKGLVRLFACNNCGTLVRCVDCGAAVPELDNGTMGCEHCGAKRERICEQCESTKFKRVKSGVRTLRKDLENLFPSADVADVDASRGYLPIAQIYVGTEAVLHRVGREQNVGLVVYVDFDQELLAPRYKAAQQAAWLLMRGSRLAGNRHSSAKVMVQTRLGGHESIQACCEADPSILLDAETRRRQELKFPPYGGLALGKGEDLETIAEADPRISVLATNERALLISESPETLAEALVELDPKLRRTIRVYMDPPRV